LGRKPILKIINNYKSTNYKEMKKLSIFLMLMAFFAPLAMIGQTTTTTVYDGTTNNDYVPAYIYYFDEYTRSQFVIPADDLTDLGDGAVISEIAFYADQAYPASGKTPAPVVVYLKEVNYTSISAFETTSSCTTVYTGTLATGTDNVMTITFDTPYTYHNGNLLIGLENTETANWQHVYFYGQTVNGASVAGSNSSSLSGVSASQKNFIPKTTLTYIPGTQPSCPKPTNLTATDNGDGTATVTWDGTAANGFNIDINGTTATGQSSPYTFNVETATTYNVTVTADCDSDGTSDPVNTSFTTNCLASEMCSITLALTDSYGDGWNGGKMQVVDATTGEVYGEYTISSGGSATYELALCPGKQVSFVYTTGSYNTENGWVIYDAAGEVITEAAGCNSGCNHSSGIQATYTMECPSCMKPSNLHATQVGTNSAVMNWEGENDSYVLQYRTAALDINTTVWHQIGEDETATASHETYTYDLSDYSGSGYVAIRHYNITNMFYLDVDDIMVTDPDGATLVSADGTSIPSDWTNLDVDGDGYVWSTSLISGVFASQSYVNNYGEVTPDNWLIIPVSNLGGTLSFTAYGQDASFPSEVFGVFVTTASLSDATATVAAGSWSADIPTSANSYQLTGLTANTPYEWQVKGICDTEQTSWVSSTFNTLADGTKAFVTTGNWNEANNWFPVGVPTISDKVFIEANVTIPAGVVATANKVILNGGTITIQDGGQLKQNGSVEITFEKEITGYGEGDANWYFISSPLTTTMLNYSSGWSYVNALTGTYDLYAFDPTQELEWINYKSSSAHANFTSGNNNPVLVSQRGYLYGHQDYIKLQFQGTTAAKSNNTVLTQDFTYDAESTDDWNGWALVGNPYTCNAYVSYVDASNNVLEANFYTLNNDNTYSLVTSSTPLAPCTGALINYSATGKVQFATEAPAAGKNVAMINMNLVKGNKTVDQARVRFGEGNNMQHMSFRNNSKLYMPVENKEYAVVYTEEQGEMPVNFNAENNGTYTLSFNTENVSLGYLHLIDNMTGNDVDLLATPSYSFEAKTTDYESRFKLVFATGNADDTFAFYSNGSFVINNEGNATLQVIDINGRIMKSESIYGCSSLDMNAAQGIYMLRLINGDNVKVQKVVVK
jgi:hypothetical protein